jgi:hypothetical protein
MDGGGTAAVAGSTAVETDDADSDSEKAGGGEEVAAAPAASPVAAPTPASDAATPAPDAATPAPDAATPAPDAATPAPDAAEAPATAPEAAPEAASESAPPGPAAAGGGASTPPAAEAPDDLPTLTALSCGYSTQDSGGRSSTMACMQPGTLQCNGCNGIVYCSKSCQQMDWGRHNPICVVAADTGAAAVAASPIPGPPPTPDVEKEMTLHEEVEFYSVTHDFKPDYVDELGAFAGDIVSLRTKAEEWYTCRLELQGPKEQQRPQTEMGVPLATADRIIEGLIPRNHLKLMTGTTFSIVNALGTNSYSIVGGHRLQLMSGHSAGGKAVTSSTGVGRGVNRGAKRARSPSSPVSDLSLLKKPKVQVAQSQYWTHWADKCTKIVTILLSRKCSEYFKTKPMLESYVDFVPEQDQRWLHLIADKLKATERELMPGQNAWSAVQVKNAAASVADARTRVSSWYADEDAFVEDMNLLFQNCFKFNPVNTPGYNQGINLRKSYDNATVAETDKAGKCNARALKEQNRPPASASSHSHEFSASAGNLLAVRWNKANFQQGQRIPEYFLKPEDGSGDGVWLSPQEVSARGKNEIADWNSEMAPNTVPLSTYEGVLLHSWEDDTHFCKEFGAACNHFGGDQLTCRNFDECKFTAHQKCMGEEYDDALFSAALESSNNYEWECAGCKRCLACKKKGDDENFLICEKCDRGMCTAPCAGLSEVPEGDWFCPTCTSA